MKFLLYCDKHKEFRWRLVARNGRVIADSGEGYKRIAACKRGIANVMRSVEAKIVKT